ncbi:MAG: pyrroline-5-carboxylate reductase [Bacteroidota bacterium]
MKTAIIGCGNLGKALARGMVESGMIEANHLFATRRNVHALEELKALGIHTMSSNQEATKQADLIILAVKPWKVVEVIEEIRPLLVAGRHMLVSVATGITMGEMQEAAGIDLPVFRAMPNTAADVGESMTCICHSNASLVQMDLVEKIFQSLGGTIQINEELMEAATILGACGIAYVMRFMRAMVQGGIQIGFSAKMASEIVNQTVKGASKLLIERGEHPENEIDKVTTPKGCTIVGLNEMEHNGFSSSLIKGIVASYEKIERT